jgi:uncharacterized membrane protein (UPF0127 family)
MTLPGRLLPLLLAAGLLAACGGGSGPESPTASPASGATITFENTEGREVRLSVEIASTPEERVRGLMFREELPEDQGMLFVFQGASNSGFWMKGTYVPLSVAFIDAAGTIIDIQDMQPLSTEIHHAPSPYSFAVEANRGWFGRNHIGAGNRARLPELTGTPR